MPGFLAALPAIASVAGGLLGAGASRSAANAQSDAADAQAKLYKQMFDTTSKNYAPYREGGLDAYGALNYMLGLGPAPIVGGTMRDIKTIEGRPGTGGAAGSRFFVNGKEYGSMDEARRAAGQGIVDLPLIGPVTAGTGGKLVPAPRGASGGPGGRPTMYEVGGKRFSSLGEAQAWQKANPQGGTPWSYELSPHTRSLISEGTQDVTAGFSGMGKLWSGSAARGVEDMRAKLVEADRNQMMNWLAHGTGIGTGAAGNTANAGAAYAAGGANAFANRGDARAAGAVGMANAFTGAANNLLGWQSYNQMLDRFAA